MVTLNPISKPNHANYTSVIFQGVPTLQTLQKCSSLFGSVLSVEVSRDPGTGVSQGCGYFTMSSIESARNAVSALDGSDVGGREMRVRYSFEMSSGRRNPEALNSAPTKHLFYESQHKLYTGNLPWNSKLEALRNLFSQCGVVDSARGCMIVKEEKTVLMPSFHFHLLQNVMLHFQ